MSKFNKKTLKETFISSDKIIIYGLSTIIITSSLTYLDNYIAKNMLILSSNSNNSTLNNKVTYSSTKEIIENTKLNSGKYISTKSDENVILASGDISATLKNISVSKTGDSSSGDDTSFYGTNPSIIVKSGTVTVDGGNYTTTGKGSLSVCSTANVKVKNATLKSNTSEGIVVGGKSGDNGGEVKLNLTSQQVGGNIVVDELFTLSMTLENSSSYEGTINVENKAKSISLKLDKNSHIKLTGNSYITSLSNDTSDNSNIDFNGYKLYVDGTAIN